MVSNDSPGEIRQGQQHPSLPNELLIEIFSFAHQNDQSLKTLRSISLASHMFHGLVTPILYSTLTIPEPSMGGEYGYPDYICLFVRTMLDTASLARHVKYVQLFLPGKGHYSWSPLGERVVQPIFQKARELKVPLDVKLWEAVNSKARSSFVALLLLLLPNIETLSFILGDGYFPEVLDMLPIDFFSDRHGRNNFAKVRKLSVDLGPHHAEGYFGSIGVPAWLQTPALSELEVLRTGYGIDPSAWPTPPISNLISIAILQGAIMESSMKYLLGISPRLKSFSYTFEERYLISNEDGDDWTTPFDVIGHLRTLSSSTLESLTIYTKELLGPNGPEGMWVPNDWHCDLVAFERLTFLHTDCLFLFGSSAAEALSLSLPLSLNKLHLNKHWTGDPEVLDAPVKCIKTAYPGLEMDIVDVPLSHTFAE
ncbi:uncharacterized protein BDZ99DRAFT_461608 [Mytilinidion resinicola]|uniref:F-box domain-containing protein n=1 Tax=Mytilinidion resinicola TaxID=574789 RepID=A0A6A6YRL8_9PEZI|nr:uncharacterized protein BDZ99DRAFT_461608 [Mytilinidion resinicola]KAF2811582.1 hypothetical protein BDZ99DRAFT_461608 [Mytilinidion resinicola]